MSDVQAHDYNESHVRPVPLEDIPKHTWLVTTKTEGPRVITTHMALRPDPTLDAWRFVDFIDVEEGWRVEYTVDIIAAEEVASLVLVRPDGSRKEMVG